MLTKEVLINSLRPYCGVIMEYDRRNGRICVHWGGELAASVRQRWLLPEELRDAIRSSGITSQETAVWSRYLNAAYLRKFFERGAESESFRMEFQGNDRRMRQYDIRVEKLDGDSLLISGRVAREDGVDALTGVYSRSYYETHLKTGEARGGVAIIDLDDLKLCNDTYGHDGGDEMLTAQLLDRLTEVSSAYRLTQAQCVTISAAAALHDVGKIGVDQSILNKPGRLTPEEFEAVKLHTVIGEELLRGMREYRGEELLETAAEICRWHHERYDGGGYPDGLKGDDIPIAAQVVSLADVYDALVSRRVYKEAYTPERAMEMIREGQCGVFNPLLVQCLTDIQDALRTEVYAGGPAS